MAAVAVSTLSFLVKVKKSVKGLLKGKVMAGYDTWKVIRVSQHQSQQTRGIDAMVPQKLKQVVSKYRT